MKRNITTGGFIALMVTLSLLFTPVSWAGNPGQGGKGGGYHKHKKVGFFTRIGRAIRHMGDHIQDTRVKTRQFFFGCKPRVWVCGYYDRNGRHVKGHWRYINHCGKGGKGGHPGQGNPGQGNPGQGNPGQGSPNPGQGDSGQGDPGQGGQAPAPAPEPTPAPEPEPTPEPAPPEPAPAPEVTAPDGASGESAGLTGGAPTDQPAVDGEVPPEPPSDGQPPAQNRRTFSGEMQYMVNLTNDAEQLNRQFKKSKPAKKGKVDPAEVNAQEVQAILVERQTRAANLVKVITKDLENTNGKGGVYYNAFKRSMSTMSKGDKEMLSDISHNVNTFIKANAAHKKGSFGDRAKEIK